MTSRAPRRSIRCSTQRKHIIQGCYILPPRRTRHIEDAQEDARIRNTRSLNLVPKDDLLLYNQAKRNGVWKGCSSQDLPPLNGISYYSNSLT